VSLVAVSLLAAVASPAWARPAAPAEAATRAPGPALDFVDWLARLFDRAARWWAPGDEPAGGSPIAGKDGGGAGQAPAPPPAAPTNDGGNAGPGSDPDG
jgi:hypothetical protein